MKVSNSLCNKRNYLIQTTLHRASYLNHRGLHCMNFEFDFDLEHTQNFPTEHRIKVLTDIPGLAPKTVVLEPGYTIRSVIADFLANSFFTPDDSSLLALRVTLNGKLLGSLDQVVESARNDSILFLAGPRTETPREPVRSERSNPLVEFAERTFVAVSWSSLVKLVLLFFLYAYSVDLHRDLFRFAVTLFFCLSLFFLFHISFFANLVQRARLWQNQLLFYLSTLRFPGADEVSTSSPEGRRVDWQYLVMTVKVYVLGFLYSLNPWFSEPI